MKCVHCESDSIGELDDRCMSCGKRNTAHHLMSTPTKSPVPKRLKGDDALDSDDDARANAARSASASVPLSIADIKSAMGEVLDQRLDERLLPLKKSIESISTELGVFKDRVRSDLESMGLRIKSVDDNVAEASQKLKSLELDVQKLKSVNIDDAIEQRLQVMSPNSSDNKRGTFNVVMGLKHVESLTQAQEWLNTRLTKAGVPIPVESFMKSDAWSGVLFVKCLSSAHQDQVIKAVRDDNSLVDKAWARVDQPIDVRTADSVLFALKRFLLGWEYTNREVHVDTDAHSLSVAGSVILKTTVENGKLKLIWADGEWEQWQELHSTAGGVNDIVKSQQDKLDQSKSSAGKGKKGRGGKGPAASSC